MTVLIDNRAGSKELAGLLPIGLESELCRLHSGDVLIVGNGPDGDALIGIEVKTVTDLVSSIDTGRLQATQLPRMLEEYDYVYLAVYGEYRPAAGSGLLQIRNKGQWRNHRLGKRPVPYGYIESFLFTVQAMGIYTKRFSSLYELCQWIGVAVRWWSKPWKKHKSFKTLDTSGQISFLPGLDNNTLLKMKVASALPGVGFDRASAAAKHFRNVAEMIEADVEEWASIPGIGKVIANSIVNDVNER